MRPLLRSKPAEAVAVMRVLEEEFKSQQKFAEAEQTRITALLWATNVARRNLGSEQVSGGEREQTATKLDATRVLTKEQMPKARDGLLDIVIRRNDPFPQVVSARMNGVSAEIAGRMLNTPLRDFPVPVRFVLDATDAKPTIITRDETGRVRITGDLVYFLKFSSNNLDRKALRKMEAAPKRDGFVLEESEAIAGATSVVERILSRPLTDWGVSTIAHDDATGVRG